MLKDRAVRWIVENIGTGAYEEVVSKYNQSEEYLLDVRNLIDKSGNFINEIVLKIREGIDALESGHKLIVCCDYGMSRSNSIAIGVLALYKNISFYCATNIVRQKIQEKDLKIEMLNTVHEALKSLTVGSPLNKSQNKKIWVTGGNGFIGRNLKELFSKDELLITKSSEIDLTKNTIKADLYIKKNNVDTIIHLANPRVFTSSEALGDSLYLLKNVLDLCKENNLYLVYPSGWEVYSGYKSAGLMANESLPVHPLGTYGETKMLCEQLIKHYAATYQLKYLILRSSPLFGSKSVKPKFIYNFIDKAKRNEEINTHEYINGKPSLDLLHIDDYCNALVKLINMKYLGALNIGSGKLSSTNAIAEIIRDSLNSSSGIKSTKIGTQVSNIVMDISKLQGIIDWAPSIDVETGIKDILRKNGH